ncbi:MAG: hypothetical protein Q7S45_01305 [Candidatus Curtissbacteria bacterium]|nr:hypothetical protein [Candidatus Curtissbacteria bacterium]
MQNRNLSKLNMSRENPISKVIGPTPEEAADFNSGEYSQGWFSKVLSSRKFRYAGAGVFGSAAAATGAADVIFDSAPDVSIVRDLQEVFGADSAFADAPIVIGPNINPVGRLPLPPIPVSPHNPNIIVAPPSGSVPVGGEAIPAEPVPTATPPPPTRIEIPCPLFTIPNGFGCSPIEQPIQQPAPPAAPAAPEIPKQPVVPSVPAAPAPNRECPPGEGPLPPEFPVGGGILGEQNKAIKCELPPIKAGIDQANAGIAKANEGIDKANAEIDAATQAAKDAAQAAKDAKAAAEGAKSSADAAAQAAKDDSTDWKDLWPLAVIGGGIAGGMALIGGGLGRRSRRNGDVYVAPVAGGRGPHPDDEPQKPEPKGPEPTPKGPAPDTRGRAKRFLGGMPIIGGVFGGRKAETAPVALLYGRPSSEAAELLKNQPEQYLQAGDKVKIYGKEGQIDGVEIATDPTHGEYRVYVQKVGDKEERYTDYDLSQAIEKNQLDVLKNALTAQAGQVGQTAGDRRILVVSVVDGNLTYKVKEASGITRPRTHQEMAVFAESSKPDQDQGDKNEEQLTEDDIRNIYKTFTMAKRFISQVETLDEEVLNKFLTKDFRQLLVTNSNIGQQLAEDFSLEASKRILGIVHNTYEMTLEKLRKNYPDLLTQLDKEAEEEEERIKNEVRVREEAIEEGARRERARKEEEEAAKIRAVQEKRRTTINAKAKAK